MGLGSGSAISRNRIPSPPQNKTTFIVIRTMHSTERYRRRQVRWNALPLCHLKPDKADFSPLVLARSVEDPDLGDWHNELAAPFANEGVLFHHFVL